MQKILIMLCILLSYQASGQVQEFVLDNGLKVLVKEDHRAPIAVSMLWYKVGSADEPGALTGVSHALEHMMFKGTTKYPLGAFSKMIAEKGGQQNAMTHYDYTVFFETIDAKHLGTVFDLEADRMTHLLWNDEEFTKEIKVIQEERRLRTDDNPKALAFERFMATAHLAAAYQHPVIGWMSSLKHLSLLDVKEWYERYYAPNNATLVVVGDVVPQEVHALAKQYFGLLPAKKLPRESTQQEPPALGKKSILIHAPAQLPLWLKGYSVPSLKTAKHPSDAYALEVISAILDAGDGGRFANNLIRGRHVASSCASHYDLLAKYSTEFVLMGIPSQNHSIKDLQKAMSLEIETLKNTLIGEKELSRVKNQLIAEKTFDKDSIFSQAMELGQLETVGLGFGRSTEFNEAIQQVKAEQIQAVARRYFQENNASQALLNPSSLEKTS